MAMTEELLPQSFPLSSSISARFSYKMLMSIVLESELKNVRFVLLNNRKVSILLPALTPGQMS